MRASGVFDLIVRIIEPVTRLIRFPTELLPLVIIKLLVKKSLTLERRKILMNNLIKLLAELKDRPLNMREKDGETIWSQTERNQIRTELIGAMVEDFAELFEGKDVEVARTADGCSISVPHTDWGNFVFSIAPKMHELQYDLYDEANKFKAKEQRKQEKKAEKE